MSVHEFPGVSRTVSLTPEANRIVLKLRGRHKAYSDDQLVQLALAVLEECDDHQLQGGKIILIGKAQTQKLTLVYRGENANGK